MILFITFLKLLVYLITNIKYNFTMNEKIGYMKLAIVGSRGYTDYNKFLEVIHTILDKYEIVPSEVISGGAKGVDTLAEDYAKEFEITPKIFEATWIDENGNFDRGAGMKRNPFIIKNSDFVIAIWDGESKGTRNSINIAKNLNKPLVVYNYINDTLTEFNIKEEAILDLG